MRIRPGDLLRVDGCASVQFAGGQALTLRVVAVLRDRPTFDGWAWLAGYALDADGTATAKREIFVQPAGLHPLRYPRMPARCPRMASPRMASPRVASQSTRRR